MFSWARTAIITAMEAKVSKIKKGDPNPFIDPAGYKAYIAARESAYRKELARQKAESR